MLENNTYSEESMPEQEPIIRPGLRQRFSQEHDRAWDIRKAGQKMTDIAKPSIQPVSDDEYRAEAAPLKDLIESVMIPKPEDLPRDLEYIWRPGNKFCLVALAFTDSGFGKDTLEPERWEQFLSTQSFMKYLEVEVGKESADNTMEVVIDEDGKGNIMQKEGANPNLTRGFGDVAGYFFDHLPKAVKKDVSEGGCTFDLHYPSPIGDFGNRIWFVERLKKAKENLKGILRAPLGMEPPKMD